MGRKCLNILSQRGVKENTKHWYVKRAEAFVRAAQGRKLLDRTVDDFNYYLEKQEIEKNKALQPITVMEGS